MVILAINEDKIHKQAPYIKSYLNVLNKYSSKMLFLYIDARLKGFWEANSRIYKNLGFDKNTVFPAITIHTKISHYHCKFLKMNLR